MSFHFLSDHFLLWLDQYGGWAIFLWLALGIFALPIPEESLLLLVGFLIAKGKLDSFSMIIAAYCGTCCGITGSYSLGLVTGRYLDKGIGRYIGLTQKRLEKAQHWFKRIGKWTLVIGYFILGIRHLTGYVAGTLRLPFRQFALFAYLGGIMWASLFISLGYFLHNHWHSALGILRENSLIPY